VTTTGCLAEDGIITVSVTHGPTRMADSQTTVSAIVIDGQWKMSDDGHSVGHECWSFHHGL